MPLTTDFFKQIKSILLCPYSVDPLGDMLIAISHLRQLHALCPQAKLGLVAAPDKKALLEVADIEIELYSPSFLTADNLLQYRRHWDLLIDTASISTKNQLVIYSYLSSHLIFINEEHFLSHLPNDEKRKKKGEKDISFYEVSPDLYLSPPVKNCHMLNWLTQSVLEYFDLEPAKLYLPPNPLTPKMETEWQPNRLRVLLSPVGAQKQIPVIEFAAILKGIQPDLLPHIDLLMVHSQIAENYHRQLKGLLPNLNIRLSPKTDLAHYLALVDSCDFVISVDTSSVHLATAYQKPLAAFYSNCPTKLTQWCPAPINDTPTLIAIGKNLAIDENDTANFDHQIVQQWINQQLTQLIAEKHR